MERNRTFHHKHTVLLPAVQGRPSPHELLEVLTAEKGTLSEFLNYTSPLTLSKSKKWFKAHW